MAEFVLKYADPRGEMHQQVAEAGSEKELRDRYSQQGFLIYSIKQRREIAGISPGRKLRATGRITSNDGRRVIFNPRYELVVD